MKKTINKNVFPIMTPPPPKDIPNLILSSKCHKSVKFNYFQNLANHIYLISLDCGGKLIDFAWKGEERESLYYYNFNPRGILSTDTS